MQLWLPHLCGPAVHRSSGLQRTQAIRMTRIFGAGKLQSGCGHSAFKHPCLVFAIASSVRNAALDICQVSARIATDRI